METFKVGDIVEAFGLEGKVISVENSPVYPILVSLYNEVDRVRSNYAFTIEGKVETWNKTPSLKFIERPRQKVKRIYYFVSCKSGDKSVQGYRMCSDFFIKKESIELLFLDEKDRQVHSIEIEEEV